MPDTTSTTRTLRLTVPWVLRHRKRRKDGKLTPVRTQPSLNEWRVWVWQRRKSHVDEVYELVGGLVVDAHWQPPAMHKARVTYVWWFPKRGRYDAENYGCKFITDALVAAGVIEDDDFAHLEPIVRMGGVDKDAPRIEVLIEEVP